MSVVKASPSIAIVAGVILLLVLQSCAWLPKPLPPSVVGNWVNPLGTVWIIKPDGTFDVDFTRDGERDAWGRYTVDGQRITLVSTGGLNASDCEGEGIYNFRRDGDKLHFTVVNDACKARQRNVLLSWRLKT